MGALSELISEMIELVFLLHDLKREKQERRKMEELAQRVERIDKALNDDFDAIRKALQSLEQPKDRRIQNQFNNQIDSNHDPMRDLQYLVKMLQKQHYQQQIIINQVNQMSEQIRRLERILSRHPYWLERQKQQRQQEKETVRFRRKDIKPKRIPKVVQKKIRLTLGDRTAKTEDKQQKLLTDIGKSLSVDRFEVRNRLQDLKQRGEYEGKTDVPHSALVAQFTPTTGKSELSIYISPDIQGVERTVTMAHQLGMAIDYRHNYYPIRLSNGQYDHEWYIAQNNPDKILQQEQTAWSYSIDLLDSVGFDRWEEFERIAQSSFKEKLKNLFPDRERQEEEMKVFSSALQRKINEMRDRDLDLEKERKDRDQDHYK